MSHCAQLQQQPACFTAAASTAVTDVDESQRKTCGCACSQPTNVLQWHDAGWTNYREVSAARGVLQGPAKAKAHVSLCARPGYVLLECQEPDIPPPSVAKRLLYKFTDIVDVDRIQRKCDDWAEPVGICAAFTTQGALYTADESTGRIGAFKRMPNCDHRYPDYEMPCMGTYVFDGRMVRRQTLSTTAKEEGVTDVDRIVSAAGGAEECVRDGDGVTSVVAQLMATYVRQGFADSPGRVGKEQCSLC